MSVYIENSLFYTHTQFLCFGLTIDEEKRDITSLNCFLFRAKLKCGIEQIITIFQVYKHKL